MLQVLSAVDGVCSTFSSCGLWGSPQAPASLSTIQAALQEQHRHLMAVHGQVDNGPSVGQDPTGEVVVLLTQLVAEGVDALRSQVSALLLVCPPSIAVKIAGDQPFCSTLTHVYVQEVGIHDII
jgi:hypothetical protein